jgi:hypothetical protein
VFLLDLRVGTTLLHPVQESRRYNACARTSQALATAPSSMQSQELGTSRNVLFGTALLLALKLGNTATRISTKTNADAAR